MEMASLAVYVAAGFLEGLRGEKVITMDLIGVRTHFADGLKRKLPHVTIPMYGHFKGEDGTKWLLVSVVTETSLGIAMAAWMERLLKVYDKMGIVGGWVFRRWPGRAKGRISDFDPLFHDALRRVQRENPNLIKPDVDVADAYSLQRSLRRGSTTMPRIGMCRWNTLSATIDGENKLGQRGRPQVSVCLNTTPTCVDH
jgi:hypothetical protein